MQIRDPDLEPVHLQVSACLLGSGIYIWSSSKAGGALGNAGLHQEADLSFPLQTSAVKQTAASAQMLPIVSVEMFLALAILETELPGQVLNVFWMYILAFAVFPLAFFGRSYSAILNA